MDFRLNRFLAGWQGNRQQQAPQPHAAKIWTQGLAFLLLILGWASHDSAAAHLAAIEREIGADDAVLLQDPRGHTLLAQNAQRRLIPASTLKILTALVALHYLGEDYRYKTEFYVDGQNNMRVKGYGDPLLISEQWQRIARQLANRLEMVKDIHLDDRFFSRPVRIPGVNTHSLEPYDAPNGALSANFNTVYFTTRKGQLTSAEAQTPLLAMVKPRLAATGLGQGRVILSTVKDEFVLYAGHLLRYFLAEQGVPCMGEVRLTPQPALDERLLYIHQSDNTLAQIVMRLMAFSNNFIANQLLLTVGAKEFGPPGTLAKGLQAMTTYCSLELGLSELKVVEGSGLSRRNRLSAIELLRILQAFQPHYHLMRYADGVYFKTGTLSGINNQAGYIEGPGRALYPFVVLRNTRGKTAVELVKRLKQVLAGYPH